MAQLTLHCPHCGSACGVEDTHIGRAVRCPQCRQAFTVPSPTPARGSARPAKGQPRSPATPASASPTDAPASARPPREARGGAPSRAGGAPEPSRLARQERSAAQERRPARHEEIPDFVLKCRKCGSTNPGGRVRCWKCKTVLRPTPLAVITTFGLLGLFFSVILSLVRIGEHPLHIVQVVLGMACMAVFWGLRSGMYWAWIAAQVLWALNIASAVVLGLLLVAKYPGDSSVIVVFASVIIVIQVLLWLYLYTRRVRAFCSGGRS